MTEQEFQGFALLGFAVSMGIATAVGLATALIQEYRSDRRRKRQAEQGEAAGRTPSPTSIYWR